VPVKQQIGKTALFAALFLSGVLCYLNIIPAPSFESNPELDEYIQESSLIGSPTLQNTMDRPFSFLYKPLSEDVEPKKGTLGPGVKARFSGSRHMEITLFPESAPQIYWLFPGEFYIVKDLAEDGVRIYKMVHGDSSAVNLAPHVPTPDTVIDRVLDLIDVHSKSVIYDLGCGDGCVLIRAAEKFGAKGVGVDIDANLIKKARKNASTAGVSSKLKFLHQDIFKTDLSKATLVYLYLLPDSLKLLRPYLEKNLKRETTVVCFHFSFPGWEKRLVAKHEIKEDFNIPKLIYIYR